MTWEAYLTGSALVVVFVVLIFSWLPTEVTLVAALTLLVATGELTGSSRLPGIDEAVAGLGNSAIVTVAILFVVVAGLRQTGAMSMIAERLLGRPKSASEALARLSSPVLLLSAFLNNTPVVAIFMPFIADTCKRTGISPSKLYLPMAYMATFGGVCTLVGTSTNLIVNGLLIESTGRGMQMFDLAWVGVPCAVVATGFLLIIAPKLLPDRQPPIAIDEDSKRYTVEMLVLAGGALDGKTVEHAGLRHLPGLFLVEIERDGELLGPVSGQQKLHGRDRLVFVGVLDSVVDLQKFRGLAPSDSVLDLAGRSAERCLIEVVVASRCPLVGSTIREGKFRAMYSAAVIAVARGSRRIDGKLGDIVLQAGDALLLEASPDFVTRERNSNHFYLVAGVDDSTPIQYERAWLALLGLVILLVAVTAGWLKLLTAAFLTAGWMLFTRSCTVAQARQSIDGTLLVSIAAALGIGRAIEQSGLASVVGDELIRAAGDNPRMVLLGVYAVTLIFTELITNNAAAILMFPIAQASAQALGVELMPFAIAIAVAASAGFATPFGYQTNLMVFGPGGYRFSDYLRVGVPLDLLFLVVSMIVIPLVWTLN